MVRAWGGYELNSAAHTVARQATREGLEMTWIGFFLIVSGILP
jgi:hypothetical protein